MKLARIILSLCFLVVVNPSQAQVKYEKEYRIDREQVPDSALFFINELAFSKRIKWYKEEGLERTSIEAKTKSKKTKKRYSIEFSKTGAFEDVEIEVDWEDMPRSTQTAICTYLERTFDKFKIQKIQVQFTGALQPIQAQVKARSVEPSNTVKTRYELITKVKVKEEFYRMELLFGEGGNLLQQSRLVSKNMDNLEY
jgi:hypothetical protein